LGMALTPDGARLLTLQLRGPETLFAVAYQEATLTPSDVEVELGPLAASGRDPAITGCAVAWPEERLDNSHAIDLRFAVLDSDGRLLGERRLLNAGVKDGYVSPSPMCASSSRAFATFFERARVVDTSGQIFFRRLPAP